MRVYLHEISDRDTELRFTQRDEWLKNAVSTVDEHFDDIEEAQKTVSDRRIFATLTLQRVDEVYVISGQIETSVHLVCSRCANTFNFSCHPRFSALFCKDLGEKRAPGAKKNFPHQVDTGDSSETKDLDITYLSTDYIDLSDVLCEQLQLQVPFQPLCRETCKGICSQCGADLNASRCSCKTSERNVFSVLRDYKI